MTPLRTALNRLPVILALGLLPSGCAPPHAAPPGAPGRAPRSSSPRIIQLAAAGIRTCALSSDGTVGCWDGFLRSHDGVLRATAVPGLERIVHLALAAERACAVDAVGRVRCWGDNRGRAADPGSSAERVAVPSVVSGVEGAVEVAMTPSASCARVQGGAVRCWGLLPDGTTGGPSTVLDRGAVQLVGSNAHCARLADESVRCWPRTDWRVKSESIGPGDVVAPELGAVVQLAASNRAVCAWQWDGTLACLGFLPCPGAPRADACLPEDATQLATTDTESCALRPGGRVRCSREREAPHEVPLPPIAQIVGGADHLCALDTHAEVWCWASDAEAEPRPVELPREVAATVFDQTGAPGCMRGADGTVRCRVSDGSEHVVRDAAGAALVVERLARHGNAAVLRHGEVASWSVSTQRGELGVATRVEGLRGVAELALGRGVWYARFDDGTVAYEPCGERSCPPTRDLPRRPIEGLTAVTGLAAGGSRACALERGGSARCWHEIDLGEDEQPRPALVAGLVGATAIAVGAGHACAIVEAGRVTCWGTNAAGQLGDGTRRSRDEPREVAGLRDAVALRLGGDWSCARLRDASVRCWGAIGPDGTLFSEPLVHLTGAPVRVTGLPGPRGVP